jgi:adenylate kinase family enzyme
MVPGQTGSFDQCGRGPRLAGSDRFVMSVKTLSRIMIIGAPGSGKSTLARAVGDGLGLPVIHFDQIFWTSGWVERPKPEQEMMARAIEAQDMWVCEGNFSRTWATRSARADLVVWLDLPLVLRFWRVLKRIRSWQGQTRPDMADGCPERLNWEFQWYILTSWPAYNRRAATLLAGLPSGKGLRLRSRGAIAEWLAAL